MTQTQFVNNAIQDFIYNIFSALHAIQTVYAHQKMIFAKVVKSYLTMD